MYCSSCGASVTPVLSYCNRCGVNLKPSEALVPAGPPPKLTGLVALSISVMFVLPLAGVAMVFAMIRELKEKAGFPLEYVMTLAVLGLLIEIVGVVLLSRAVMPLIKAYLQAGPPVEKEKPTLTGSKPAQLEAPREPASSVTENTTRAFEPAYREQRTR